MKTRKTLAVTVAVLVGAGLYLGDLDFYSAPLGVSLPTFRIAQAEAVIGRPLTPLSYAGVARRTARRTTRRIMRRTAYYLTALPPGCAYGYYFDAYYYNCAGTYYARDNDVYVQVIVEDQ